MEGDFDSGIDWSVNEASAFITSHMHQILAAWDKYARMTPAAIDMSLHELRGDKLFAATGLATSHAPTQSQRDAMTLNAVVKLMKDDCNGKSGTTPTAGSILLDGMPVCRTFQAEVDVTKAEGVPIFGGELALQKTIDACASRHEVRLGLRDGDAWVSGAKAIRGTHDVLRRGHRRSLEGCSAIS